MKTLVFTIIRLIAALGGGVLAARGVGLAWAPPPGSYPERLVSEMQRGAKTWCWRGVCPGQATMADVLRLPQQWPDVRVAFGGLDRQITVRLEASAKPRWTALVQVRRDSGEVIRIELHTELNPMTLGQFVSMVGTPTTRRAQFAYGLWTTVLCFPGQLCAGVIDNGPQVSPHTKVDFIQFAVDDVRVRERLAPLTRTWRGFVSP